MIVTKNAILEVMSKEGALGDRTSCSESLEFVKSNLPKKVDFKKFKEMIDELDETWKRDFEAYLSDYSNLKMFEDLGFCKQIKKSKYNVNGSVFSSKKDSQAHKKLLVEEEVDVKMGNVHITAFKDTSHKMGDFKQIISYEDADENTDFEVTCCNGNKVRLGSKNNLTKHLNSLKRVYRAEINKQIAIKQLITDEEEIFTVWIDLEE